MNLFLDTSSLVTLYHEEADTEIMDALFHHNMVTNIFLSEISKIEFSSTFWKKNRTGEISRELAEQIISVFEKDCATFIFIPVDYQITENARRLLSKYGNYGLRTLDSIQLATATCLREKVDFFKSGDKLLVSFMNKESLPTSIS
ncbi:type II toxin-antitoxin system VapC family toxin [Dyadobacter sp. Leaf189]|uniref:type II toxin-antitoxin system VapC family toxin n=1 Tax=Dyadobacter sp. Leaf189 TaxID=1736295 RepID=UPI0006FE9DDC|nr:type II toxin-antitoxin system VapC family toxin [Dyadobacter sp. Leaf189]KQS27751.1 hypothetical protein ASG33_15075 [Dyadobacter sp. Leaf189]